MTLSAYFAVQLPGLTDEQLVKIYTWGKETCVQSNLVIKKEGGFLLIAQKEEHGLKLKEDIRVIWGDYIKEPQIKNFPEIIHFEMERGQCMKVAYVFHS